jgi:hypothetical protein
MSLICPRPCYNLLSVATPILGIVGAIIVVCVEDYFYHEHPAHYPKTASMTYAVYLLFGFVSACVAVWRRERSWGVTALGLALDVPFVFIARLAPWDWPF